MKKQNLIRNLTMAALIAAGIFIIGSGNSVYAHDTGNIGSGCCSKGGYLGSGNRDGDGGGTIGSGTRAENGGMLGSGTITATEDGGHLGSGVGRNGLVGSTGGRAESIFGAIWEFFF